MFEDGLNTVSESTVSNTELSKLFGPHRVPGREVSEFVSLFFVSKFFRPEYAVSRSLRGLVAFCTTICDIFAAIPPLSR